MIFWDFSRIFQIFFWGLGLTGELWSNCVFLILRNKEFFFIFWKKSDFLKKKKMIFWDFWIFDTFLHFLDFWCFFYWFFWFSWIYFVFFIFQFLFFILDFLRILNFSIFFGILDFFLDFCINFKVTKVTNKRYGGYYRTPKMA